MWLLNFIHGWHKYINLFFMFYNVYSYFFSILIYKKYEYYRKFVNLLIFGLLQLKTIYKH